MPLAKEFLGTPLMEKSPFINSFNVILFDQKKGQFSLYPAEVRTTERSSLEIRKAARRSSNIISPVAAISEENLVKVVPEKAVEFKVRAVVTVRNKHKEDLKESILKQFDALTDKIGRTVVLELVSTEIDQSKPFFLLFLNPNDIKFCLNVYCFGDNIHLVLIWAFFFFFGQIDEETKAPKKSKQAVLKDWSKKSKLKTERVNYTAEFVVDSNFGVPGAITVANKHQQEFFLESITVEGFACGPVHFSCKSWVPSQNDHPGKGIFFSNQVQALVHFIFCIYSDFSIFLILQDSIMTFPSLLVKIFAIILLPYFDVSH